jgi:hypothetical protein
MEWFSEDLQITISAPSPIWTERLVRRGTMWFDCVIIDKISADGTLDSYHIRARSGEPLTTDKLEDIDPSFRKAVQRYGMARTSSRLSIPARAAR